MYISKIRVKNYKSFRDSGVIEFKSGINIIVGQNNAGKTTLLESLEMRFNDIPHLSLKMTKDSVNKKKGNSILYVSLEVSRDDLPKISEFPIESLLKIPFPKSILDEMFTQGKNPSRDKELEAQKERRKVLDEYVDKFNKALSSGMRFNISYFNENLNYGNLNFGFVEEKPDEKMDSIVLRWDESALNFNLFSINDAPVPLPNPFGWVEMDEFREKIYRFSAERPNLGTCIVGFGKELRADASNLAEVLQNIKNDNPDVFEEFNKYVSEVIPSVKWISSNKIETPQSGIGGNWNEVRVWSVDKKTRRTDLAFPLSECGTGVGQVLAILYVAIASEEPRTIIIDEPNSFLHPGAAKKLIQILNKFPQHQYFISTHSPEILSVAKPSTITQLRYVDGETIAESINPEQTKDLRETLDEIGVKFADIFFSENILWVEGETEEKAFPLILETADELFDVVVLPLVHTDDLKQRKSKGQKHAKLVFEIYERLSGANALTPPFVAVILDKESSTQEELDKLTQTFGDRLKFIPRKMYENYLLDAEAITNILNGEIFEDENKLSVEQVEEWINEKRNAKFLTKKDSSEEVLESTEWLEKVHAAELFEKLFSDLSNQTVEYRKTTHSVKLTQWLLENKPELLIELKEFLINILSDKN